MYNVVFYIILLNTTLYNLDTTLQKSRRGEWGMERQGVSTQKDNGIVNDTNDWVVETVRDARYPLELLQRVITGSLRTMEIVRGCRCRCWGESRYGGWQGWKWEAGNGCYASPAMGLRKILWNLANFTHPPKL